jgi:hypothetical protein
MRVARLVLALGVVLAPLAARGQQTGGIGGGAVLRWPQDFIPRPPGPLILAVDAASGMLVSGAHATHVDLVDDTLPPGYYQLSVVAPGYQKTSVRVFIDELTTPLLIKLEKAISSDPRERHPAKQR